MKKTLLFLVTCCLFAIQGWSQCNPPTNLAASNITQSSLTLNWTPGDTSQHSWEIQFKISYDTVWETSVSTFVIVTTNSYVIVGLTNSVPYDFRVRAICSSTEQSNWSSSISTVVIGYPCNPPLNIEFTDITSTSANVVITPSDSINSNWLLQYRINNDIVNSVELDTTHYTITGLTPDTYYSVFVTTKCDDSYSYPIQGGFLTSPLNINVLNNNKTFNICGNYMYDDGGEIGDHGSNYNYTTTLCPTNNENHNKRTSVRFDEFSLGSGDYMIAYSGRSSVAQSLLSINGVSMFTGNSLQGQTLMSKVSDTTGCITFNVVTNPTGASTGFKGYIDCIERCQIPVAALDTFFIKYDALGNMTTHFFTYVEDSIYSHNDSSLSIVNYKSIDLCQGDSVVLIAKPQFSENDLVYHQSINNCIYSWSFGDGQRNTIHNSNIVSHKWNDFNIYNLNLTVKDTNLQYINGEGCASRNSINTRVRFSRNPIKSISYLPTICSGKPFLLDAGYDSTSYVIIDTVGVEKETIGIFDSVVIIPDGPICGEQSYFTPIYFNEFRNGAIVTSVNDILSLCMNIEHSFAGDLGYRIYCPNGSYVWLAYNRHNYGNQLGVPNDPGGGQCCFIDLSTPGSDCYPGTGWTYCWSNKNLTNARGIFNDYSAAGGTIDSTHVSDTAGYFQTPTQTGQTFAANGDCLTNCNTLDLNGFSPLIGCPLNGEWKLEVRDNFGVDNGFIFWWNLELGQNSRVDWDYQVGLDSVVWTGPFTQPQTPTTSLIVPPFDSIGTYNYNIHIVDNFGCVWDTTTTLNIAQSPYTPTDLHIEMATNYLELTWQGNASLYEVYRDDSLIATVFQTMYIDSSINITTNYCYKVKAIGTECESEFSERLCSLIGLEDVNSNDLSVTLYPNPTNDKTILKVDGLKNNADVIVYDLQGRAIKTYKMNARQTNLEIDVKSFAKGIYNIKLVNSDCNITKKLIVK